jgi:hypothetical protein
VQSGAIRFADAGRRVAYDAGCDVLPHTPRDGTVVVDAGGLLASRVDGEFLIPLKRC